MYKRIMERVVLDVTNSLISSTKLPLSPLNNKKQCQRRLIKEDTKILNSITIFKLLKIVGHIHRSPCAPDNLSLQRFFPLFFKYYNKNQI